MILCIKIEITDNYIHLIFKVKVIQKTNICVLRKNSTDVLNIYHLHWATKDNYPDYTHIENWLPMLVSETNTVCRKLITIATVNVTQYQSWLVWGQLLMQTWYIDASDMRLLLT